MSRLAALNAHQVVSEKFPETQNFKRDRNDSCIYILFIKQVNLKHKANEF